MSIRNTTLMLLLFTMLIASPCTAADYPHTPAGERLRALASTINSPDHDLWHSFIKEHWWEDGDTEQMTAGRLEFIQFIGEQMGGVELVEITDATDTSISAILRGTNPRGMNDHLLIHLFVDASAPHKIAQVGAEPASDPTVTLPDRPLTDSEIASMLHDYLSAKAAEDRFSGAILLARDSIVLLKAYGEASRQYHVPNRTDTKFNLGSMNKMFTGVAIAQLAQQGKLAFTDTVGTYLPEYPNERVRNEVTIHQLLTHTSGMGSYWQELFDTTYWELNTTKDLASIFWNKPLEFKPGERFNYSNCGPVVLGLIIEAVSNLSYDDYIRQFITGPAGMINTDCYRVDEPVANLAIGYTQTDYQGNPTDTWRANFYMHAVKGGPAGGGFSTVEDLFRFHQALRDHVLLDPEHTELVITGKVPMGPDMSYGYLFGDKTFDNWRIVGHSGGAPGINAILDMYWDQGWTVAVMANCDDVVMAVSDYARRLLTHKR